MRPVTILSKLLLVHLTNTLAGLSLSYLSILTQRSPPPNISSQLLSLLLSNNLFSPVYYSKVKGEDKNKDEDNKGDKIASDRDRDNKDKNKDILLLLLFVHRYTLGRADPTTTRYKGNYTIQAG